MKSLHFTSIAVLLCLIFVGCSNSNSNNQSITNAFTPKTISQAPPAVVAGFHREFPTFHITKTIRQTNMGANSLYRLSFRDAKNVLQEKQFASDGTFLDTTIGVNMPKTVASK